MRKVLVLAAAFCLAAATPFAQAPSSGKTATSWTCASANPTHSIPVAGDTTHVYSISTTKCTANKGEVAGVKEVDGTATEFTEVMGDKMKGHGIFVENYANGDKATFSYEFTGTLKDKTARSVRNKYTMTSGTGMFKGATASGTCTGKGTPDGGASFDCTGGYTLAK